MLKIAQFSDCHLFAQSNGLHYGVNVYQNLLAVLDDIKRQAVDVLIFTGDLSQDHSEASYQLFVKAVNAVGISQPIYYVAGNHDDSLLLNRYLINQPFQQEKLISNAHWQIVLINSTGETPAGFICPQELERIEQIDTDKHVLLVMHHHPIKVGFGIDKHGLINHQVFWQVLGAKPNIKTIVCGHVHNGFKLAKHINQQWVTLYTCPATSVEFDAKAIEVTTTATGPGYQLLALADNGAVVRELIYL